jgi:hypothetical protein
VVDRLPCGKLTVSGREVSRAAPLVLVYDSEDAEARAVAERVAVILREVGIAVQILGQTVRDATKSSVAEMRLVRQHIGTPDPATAPAATGTAP